jgi:putative tricarboxylic transport membrane protein
MSQIHPSQLESDAGATIRSRLYSDWTAAGGVLVILVVLYYLAMQIGTVPEWLLQGIQPANYPKGVIIAIGMFIVLMMLDARRNPSEVPERVPALVYSTTLAMFVSVCLSTYFDFFLGIIFFICVAIPLWGMRKYAFTLFYAVAFIAVVYVLFSTALGVRFPHGPLTDLFP